MSLPVYPFETSRNIGTVIQVNPVTAKANLPWASLANAKFESGYRIGAGEVGEFVFIENGSFAVFGKITDVRLPDNERLTIEDKLGSKEDVNPIGFIQLLSSIDLSTKKVCKGIPSHPRLGAKVYSAHELLVAWMINNSNEADLLIELATVPNSGKIPINIQPSHLFGRHCAVLGTTGGGKSYTLSQIMTSINNINGKVILLDPTGEYKQLGDGVLHYSIGGAVDGCTETSFPCVNMVERDLFALFQPSAGSQTPKFREAIKSLKLLECDPSLGENGVLKKSNKSKAQIESAVQTHASFLAQPGANFDVSKIAHQIFEECIYPSANFGRDPSKYGDYNQQDYSYQVSLIARIEAAIGSDGLSCIFKPDDKKDLTELIDSFLESDDRILRITFEELPFEFNAREIITNALGRFLLSKARNGKFKTKPLVVALDEAHQFLDKSIGDDLNGMKLDAFGLIAKEGRKYSLTTIIATQRPRDIPEDVLSQIGTLIVHRLVNNRDREVVERACGDIDKSASSFLPTLGPGEALIVGVDFPVPMTVQINKSKYPPISSGANYDEYWGDSL